MAIKTMIQAARHWLRDGHPQVRRRRMIATGVGVLLVWFVLGGRQGLFALAMSQREKASLRAQIDELTTDNATLRTQADALARDPQACEKTAREQLQLMRPGEIIYRFQ